MTQFILSFTILHLVGHTKSITLSFINRVLDRWVPNSWQDTLRAFKEAATYKDDCKKQFPCANPDQQ